MSKHNKQQRYSDTSNKADPQNGCGQPRTPQSGLVLPLGAKAGGLSFTAVVLISLVINVIFSGIIQTSGLTGTDGEKYLSLLVSPIAIAVVLTLALTVLKQPVKRLLPVKTRPVYFVMGLLIIFGLLFSLSWVNDWLIKLFELMGYQRRESFLPDMSGGKVVAVLLVVAVIPPVMEEVLFRGVLLQNVEEEVGSIRTVFLVGMCFALYHGSVEQTIYQFICGCLFALITVRSRSLLPAMLMHLVNNAIIIIFTACGLTDPMTGELVMSQAAYITVTVLSALSLVGGTVWLILDKTELKPCKSGSVKAFFIYAAVGIGAMIIMWIAGLFVS